MKRIKFIHYFSLIFSILIVTKVRAQTIPSGSVGIVYTYDATGNRIDRKYVANNSPSETAGINNKDSSLIKTKNSFKTIQVNALYPNPTTGKVTISLVSPVDNATVQIFDAAGRLILQNKQSGNQLKVDLSRYRAGIYFLHLLQKEGYLNLKVIKK